MIHYFHQLSLSGLAANLLLVPLLELALLLTLAGYALLPVFGLGKLLFLLAGLLLHPLLNIIHWLASGGWATVTVGSWYLYAALSIIYCCCCFSAAATGMILLLAKDGC